MRKEIILIFAVVLFILGCSSDNFSKNWDSGVKQYYKEINEKSKESKKLCQSNIGNYDDLTKVYITTSSTFTSKEHQERQQSFDSGFAVSFSTTSTKAKNREFDILGYNIRNICKKGSEVGENINYFYCQGEVKTSDKIDSEGNIESKSSDFKLYFVLKLTGKEIEISPNWHNKIYEAKVIEVKCES